jgi:hypothetical protein
MFGHFRPYCAKAKGGAATLAGPLWIIRDRRLARLRLQENNLRE